MSVRTGSFHPLIVPTMMIGLIVVLISIRSTNAAERLDDDQVVDFPQTVFRHSRDIHYDFAPAPMATDLDSFEKELRSPNIRPVSDKLAAVQGKQSALSPPPSAADLDNLNLRFVSPDSVYVSLSIAPKSCLENLDCYAYREPNEWCSVPSSTVYERGCFCDRTRFTCVIERRTPYGYQFTDCSPKSASICN